LTFSRQQSILRLNQKAVTKDALKAMKPAVCKIELPEIVNRVPDWLQIVDLPWDYWQNDHRTLVFVQSQGD